jgi:hypothetical protein
MGSGAGGYVTIQLITYSNDATSTPGKLLRTSRLVFSPAEQPTLVTRPPLTLPGSPGPAPGKPPACKVALGGLTNGEVKKFDLYAYTDSVTAKPRHLMGMGTKPSSDVANEAFRAFGGEWAGFDVALGPAGGRFDLVADVELIPRWPAPREGSAAKPFQVIPVVVAFGTDLFKNHYLLSVIVAQKSSDLMDTAVTQAYQ